MSATFAILPVFLDISKGSQTDLVKFYVNYGATCKSKYYWNYGIILCEKHKEEKINNPHLSYLFFPNMLPLTHIFFIWPNSKCITRSENTDVDHSDL